MRHAGLTIGALALGSVAAAAPVRAPVKGVHKVEVDDPKSDVGSVQTGSVDKPETQPGFDMEHLSIRSDGKQLTIAATLTEAPGANAGRAVDVYVDRDNDPKSGATLPVEKIGGVEYFLQLDSCVAYEGEHGRTTCAVPHKAKPTANAAAIQLQRYKGTDQYDKEPVLRDAEFGPGKPSVKTPVTGRVLQASLDYADLQVKPGQKIRIVAGEWNKKTPGIEILLTLK
jgi:hypothetical protein